MEGDARVTAMVAGMEDISGRFVAWTVQVKMRAEHMAAFLRQWRGRWQIPALLLGVVAFVAGAAILYRPQPPPPLDEEIARIAAQRSNGRIAPEAAQVRLAELIAERPEAGDRADFWFEMGKARWQVLSVAGDDGKAVVVAEAVAAAFGNALDRGLPAEDVPIANLRLGQAHRYAGQLVESAAALRLALAGKLPRPWRTKRILLEVEFERARYEDAEQIAREIEADTAAGEYQRNWAAARRLELMINQKRSKEVIAELADGWRQAPPRNALAYGRALWMEGRKDDAEPVLRAVRQAAMDDAEPEVDGVAAYLLGRIIHEDGAGNAAEAQAFFRVANQRYPDTPVELAGLWGLARTAATLQEHDESFEKYRQLIALLANRGHNEWISPVDIREDLRGLWDRFSDRADFARAARAARLLADLAGPKDPEAVEKLGEALLAAGEALKQAATAQKGEEAKATAADSRLRFAEAGGQFLRLAELRFDNDLLFQSARWRAIACFGEAADSAKVISLLEEFAGFNPINNPRLPDARLLLGRAYYASEEFGKAEAVLRENVEDPLTLKSPASYASYVPLAQCYLSMDRGSYPKAEGVLLRIVEGKVPGIGPKGEHFKAATFLIGEVYYRMKDYDRALKRFADAVGMYPDNGRVTIARYYVADCYRRQAAFAVEQLKTEKKEQRREQLQQTVTDALHKAARTFRRVIDELYIRTADEDTVQATHLRNACFFEAGCYFDLGMNAKAIELYEDAIFRYRTRLESVLACISVHNACERMGAAERGRIYIRRGLKLLEKMPESEFSRYRGLYKRPRLAGEMNELLRAL